AINGGSIQCFGEDGALGRGVFNLYEDKKGNLWASVQNGLWRWRPGTPAFLAVPTVASGREILAEDSNGALLIIKEGGISRLVDGKIEAYQLPGSVRQFRPGKVLHDRDGGLWIGTSTNGLVHVHQGKTDGFSSPDGLSGDDVVAIFEDREGNIWVATLGGLDRFREFAIPTLTLKEGLSNAAVLSVLAVRDGSLLFATIGGLNRWNNGQLTVHDNSAPPAEKINNLPYSLFQDARGRIWAATLREFGYLENDRVIPVKGMPGGVARSIVEDTDGNLWVANQNDGLFLLRGNEVAQQVPWDKLGHTDFANALAFDPLQGGVWLGFFQGGLVYLGDGRVKASYSSADGLGEGRVNDLRIDLDGTIWAATEGGLSRLKNKRFATLTIKNGLPCDTIHWSMEDDYHSLWLYTTCGLVRIARVELDRWTDAVDQDNNTKPTIQVTVFGISDGVDSRTYSSGYSPQVARATDGKLWFPGFDGVSVVDPHNLSYNNVLPPVHIEHFIPYRT